MVGAVVWLQHLLVCLRATEAVMCACKVYSCVLIASPNLESSD